MPGVPWVRPSQGSLTVAGKGDRPQAVEFLGGSLHQQAHFPMPGMIAQGDGLPSGARMPPMRAQDQKFLGQQAAKAASPYRHSGVRPKMSPLALVAQLLSVQRQVAFRPGGVGRHLIN